MMRPQGKLAGLSRGGVRPAMEGSVLAPLMLATYALGVVLVFALAVTVVLDTARFAPPAVTVQSSFAARTDAKTPYEAQPEMTIKPLRSSAAAAGAD